MEKVNYSYKEALERREKKLHTLWIAYTQELSLDNWKAIRKQSGYYNTDLWTLKNRKLSDPLELHLEKLNYKLQYIHKWTLSLAEAYYQQPAHSLAT